MKRKTNYTKVAFWVMMAMLLVSVICFWEYVLIHVTAMVPVVMIIVCIILSGTHKLDAKETDDYGVVNSTEYDNLSRNERSSLFRIISQIQILIIPILSFFIFFFHPVARIFIPILIFAASFPLARIVFIIQRKHSK